jgi:hypothetical protein
MNLETSKRGTELHPDDQKHVLAAYVHRFTGQHRPQWADSQHCNVQFRDDADWLANTSFAVRKNGRLDRRSKECYSRPTWPNNPELRNAALV